MGHGLLGYPRGDVSANRLILSGLSCSDPEGYRSGKKGLSRGKRWGGLRRGRGRGCRASSHRVSQGSCGVAGKPGRRRGQGRRAQKKGQGKSSHDRSITEKAGSQRGVMGILSARERGEREQSHRVSLKIRYCLYHGRLKKLSFRTREFALNGWKPMRGFSCLLIAIGSGTSGCLEEDLMFVWNPKSSPYGRGLFNFDSGAGGGR